MTETMMVDLDQELGRFFQIGKELFDETGEMAMMPTCVVDARWHALIENGKIDELVEQHLGGNVAVEHIERGGVDPINWVGRYEAKFGPLSPLWFTGENGLDTELYGAYTRQGATEMSWDCGPLFAPIKDVTMSWDCGPAFAEKQPTRA